MVESVDKTYDKAFAKKHDGKMFLDVEDRGRIWWIKDGRRWQTDDLKAFRKAIAEAGLVTGIKHSDLEKIPIGK